MDEDSLMGAASIRPGEYLCSCPNYAPHVAAKQRHSYSWAREQLVDSLLTRTGTNSSLELLQQLSSERQHSASSLAASEKHRLANWLRDAPLSGGPSGLAPRRVINRRRADGGAGYRREKSFPSMQAHGGEREQRVAAYFALGAQLEADAMLDAMLDSTADEAGQAQVSVSWPRQTCSLCVDEHLSAATPPAPVGAPGEPQCDEAGGSAASLGANGGGADERASNWIRPLILCLQLSCILSTFALIGIILRIRKSRVCITGQQSRAEQEQNVDSTLPFPLPPTRIHADYHTLRLANARNHASWSSPTVLKRKWPSIVVECDWARARPFSSRQRPARLPHRATISQEKCLAQR